jgi:nucleotide-binding universal stress UspA family protein
MWGGSGLPIFSIIDSQGAKTALHLFEETPMLPKYQKILVATDLTPNSEHAFKHAVVLARYYDASVYLLHVVPEVDASVRSYVSTIMGQGSLDKFESRHEEEARKEIRQELETFAREELAGHREDLERIAGVNVLHGHPVARILQEADRIGADLIVLGTHGKGAVDYAFLGSVAEKLLRKSRKPVLIIPFNP